MANLKAFQILIPVENHDRLKEGLRMPPMFRNQLSRNCTSIKLVDSQNKEYYVCIKNGPGEHCFLYLAQWGMFVNAVIHKDIRRLCFRLVSSNKFQVFSFDRNGLEYTRDDKGQLKLSRFLCEASEQTYDTEFAADSFLDMFNVRVIRDGSRKGPPTVIPDKKARIIGTNQHEDVKLIYKLAPDHTEWKAVGFAGPKWTNLCFENNVEPGYTLMFTKVKDAILSLDVFNSADVGIGIADTKVDDDDMEDLIKEDGCYVFEEPDDRDFIHQCRLRAHQHKLERPMFLCKLIYSAFTQKRLTVEKPAVLDFGLNKYNTAVIKFGRLDFSGKLKIKKDRHVVGEQTHVVMLFDWRHFSGKTGIIEGDWRRFEVDVNKSMGSKTLYLDVC